jgi:hypothetical protein
MPTDNPYVAQWALQSVLEGLSANEGLRQFRESGGHVGRSTWLQARGEVERVVADREGVYDEQQHLIPNASEIQTWTTKGSQGYVQQVEVLARDNETQQVISIPYSRMGTELVSRAQAIQEAIDLYSQPTPSREGQAILGGVYTGTYQAKPMGSQ